MQGLHFWRVFRRFHLLDGSSVKCRIQNNDLRVVLCRSALSKTGGSAAVTWQPSAPAGPSRCCVSDTPRSACSAAAHKTRNPPPSPRPPSAWTGGTHRRAAPPHMLSWVGQEA